MRQNSSSQSFKANFPKPWQHSRPARLRDIADRFNLDQEAVLDNVLYARAYTSKICYNASDHNVY